MRRRTSVGGSFARTGLPSAVGTTSHNAANQQTAFGSQTLAGNLTSDGVNTFTWNARDQLVSMIGSRFSGLSDEGFDYSSSNLLLPRRGYEGTTNTDVHICEMAGMCFNRLFKAEQ